MAQLSMTAALGLLSRIAALEDDTVANEIITALRDDPEWLQLPPARRETALRRYRALRAYDRKKSPTKADAAAAASELDVQLRSFYAMLRDWRDRQRSPLALVPYRANEASPRASRLDAEVADKLTALVRTLLEREPLIAPGKAVRAVEADWPVGLKRPSGVTVRAFLDRERASSAPRAGSLRLNLGIADQEAAETATRFGEVLVVDHTSPARLLLPIDGRRATAPTVTLAIDLWSGVPVGAAVTVGEPSPEAVLDALADAEDRMDELAGNAPSSEAVQPRIVYASTAGKGWDRLRNDLLEGGLQLVERRDHRLHFGGPTKRMLGARLGGIPLQASKARRSSVVSVDPDQDALLTMNQMRFVIDVTIDRLVSERLQATDESRVSRLLLPEKLLQRDGLKARIRPLIELNEDGDAYADANLPNAADASEPRKSVADIEASTTDATFGLRLLSVAQAVAGAHLVDAQVQEPTPAAPGWLVRVVIDGNDEIADVWLRLAREAVAIADAGGDLARFEVEGLRGG